MWGWRCGGSLLTGDQSSTHTETPCSLCGCVLIYLFTSCQCLSFFPLPVDLYAFNYLYWFLCRKNQNEISRRFCCLHRGFKDEVFLAGPALLGLTRHVRIYFCLKVCLPPTACSACVAVRGAAVNTKNICAQSSANSVTNAFYVILSRSSKINDSASSFITHHSFSSRILLIKHSQTLSQGRTAG